MNENSEDMDVLSLVKKIQQHLVFLEKKLDTLIGQSSQRPQHSDRPFKGKPFSKPFRPTFGAPRHGGKPGHGNRSGGERDFSQGRPSFGKRPDGAHRGGFGQNKKPFFPRRKEQS